MLSTVRYGRRWLASAMDETLALTHWLRCGGGRSVRFAQAIVAEKGTDAWFYMSTEDLLPEKYRSMAESLRKGTDTMDVWFDSGSSWASVVNQREGLRLPVRVDATPPPQCGPLRPFAPSRVNPGERFPIEGSIAEPLLKC